ncbi:ATP-binding cassette domain-containing protein [Paenibacillus cremeus]|uniref:ATP-binding cassette domain-containing protein n=1 Tax=Paenibacillus cremeus TaxID=2163881 RepID=UPI0021BD0018|nr:ATP-binding cassette domain-containing protein [Paenibacillus cremeus]
MEWVREMSEKMNEEHLEYVQLKSASQFTYRISSATLLAVFLMVFFGMFHAGTGEMLLIILIFSRLWPRFVGIQSNLEQIAAAVPSLKALLDLKRECLEDREIEVIESGPVDGRKPLLVRQQIELRDVFFKYGTNEAAYALQRINLRIPANRLTAIVGRSGAGKSTLIDLIMGLLQPEQGMVLLDGTPLTKDRNLYWRRSISYVRTAGPISI